MRTTALAACWAGLGTLTVPMLAASPAEATVPSPGGPVHAHVAPDQTLVDEWYFINRINQIRASWGVAPLLVDPELTAHSRAWSTVMSEQGRLHHGGDLSIGVTRQWSILGENVGVHSIHDLEALVQAFMASPGHRANLLDSRYTRIGVGVVHGPDGSVWTTHRFMGLRHGR